MGIRVNTDNIYKTGTVIFAKAAPDLKLLIMRYYHRIYYCAVAGDPTQKHYVYFERELIAPANIKP